MIADYSLYNTLVVSAPEIAGKWDMAPIPGTKREDGGLDRSVASNSTACILLSQSKNKEAAWKYMSWWVSRDTQTLYGKELESVLGEAARYATANIEAQESIAWSSKALSELTAAGTMGYRNSGGAGRLFHAAASGKRFSVCHQQQLPRPGTLWWIMPAT